MNLFDFCDMYLKDQQVFELRTTLTFLDQPISEIDLGTYKKEMMIGYKNHDKIRTQHLLKVTSEIISFGLSEKCKFGNAIVDYILTNAKNKLVIYVK